jgi:3-oxoacyl-[acyl-carrier-protein] synthase II
VAAARGSDGKLDMKAFGSEGIGTFFPLWMLKYLPNMLSCHVSIFHDLQGVSNTVTTGNTSAHQSIGEALNIVRRDNADIMVAGAGESKVHPLVMARMNLQGLLPSEEGEPAAASRPFDKTHAGSLASEGAGILVLEEAGHAEKRGRTPLAEIAGFSAVCGGSSPHCYEGMREPVEKAIRRALEQAGVSPEDVSLISACGYGVPNADREEAAAIRAIFPEGVPVTAMKSMLGNAGAGSGAVELVGAVEAMTHGVIPPTLNFTEPDPECAIAPVTEPTEADLHTVVSLAFTLGGQASAIVLKKA